MSVLAGLVSADLALYCKSWWLSKERICLQGRRRSFNSWVGKVPWRRKRQPTPVFLPGKSQGQRSLVGYSPQSHKEPTQLSTHTHWKPEQAYMTRWWSAYSRRPGVTSPRQRLSWLSCAAANPKSEKQPTWDSVQDTINTQMPVLSPMNSGPKIPIPTLFVPCRAHKPVKNTKNKTANPTKPYLQNQCCKCIRPQQKRSEIKQASRMLVQHSPQTTEIHFHSPFPEPEFPPQACPPLFS